MAIQTERLEIFPLTARQLKLWLEDIGALEDELKCRYSAEPLEGTFRDIVRGQLAKAEDDSAHYQYHSFWLLMRKSDRNVVGACDFKDIPDENQEVEIGYGLGKAFEHMGYMTEAIGAFCKWALEQDGIAHVIAETEHENIQSANVLKRVGFIPYRQSGTTWWRL